MSEHDDPAPLPRRIYWWVALVAITEMLLLFWLTQALNVPMPGGS